MRKQINEIISIVSLLFLLNSCHIYQKKYHEDNHEHAFKEYLANHNIEFTEFNNSYYSKHYTDFLGNKIKDFSSKKTFLKFNQVYVYQGDKETIKYFVFTDRGYVYTFRTYKEFSEFVSISYKGKIRIKKPLSMLFYGFYELKDKSIKIKLFEKKDSKELYFNDIGLINKDTIMLTANYESKGYSYEKKKRAKIHKTNFKLVHQPDLIATPIKHIFWGNTFRVEGEFKDEYKEILKENIRKNIYEGIPQN